VIRAIVLYLASGVLFSGLDTVAKAMTGQYDPLQVTWGRYVFHAVFVGFLVPRYGLLRPFISARLGFQIYRAALLAGVTFLSFISVKFLPLAEVTAIGFATPLILTALAFFVLRERVGPRRWTAVALGFIGVAMIVRPGSGVVHWAAFVALAMAAGNAFFHLATRQLSAIDSPQTTMYYTGVVGAVILTLIVPTVWRTPDLVGWIGMMAMGFLGGGGHLLLIKAYQHTQASLLAPYTYIQIVWITILGLVVFDNFPDTWTIGGTALIIASGIYVFLREAHLRRAGRL
jgi:drug/metabolite transporter (DMT)-like permease